LPAPINQAAFKAAKPLEGKPTIVKVDLDNGGQALVSVSQVKAGTMTEEDKKKQAFATKNIAKALGQSTLAAVMKNLEADADVTIHK
jgi:peptidyl-prolyl cis-trans isomerase D